MLDEARQLGPPDTDFVEFHAAGAPAKGTFVCSNCGYGVAIQATLPKCPMCGGTTWERGGTTGSPSPA